MKNDCTQHIASRSRWARARIALSRCVGYALLFLAFTAESRWRPYPVVSCILFLIGCVLVALATVGRLWSSLFICGYKTDRLITTGPYSMTRNPLYFFSLIGAIGVGLATETLTIPLIIALAFAIYYPPVIQNEEARLQALHGEAFTAYRAKVPRFWPKRLSFDEPETYTVIPVTFRKAMGSVFWFVVFIGVVKMGDGLREAHLLPTLMRLW